MNKKDLRELPATSFGTVLCINCGMQKWTSAIASMNSALTMTSHVSSTSHCCDNPHYIW